MLRVRLLKKLWREREKELKKKTLRERKDKVNLLEKKN